MSVFLQQLLNDDIALGRRWTFCWGQMIYRSPGVLQLKVDQLPPQEAALILSCAVHGNETAPVEIVAQLVDQIIDGSVIVQRSTLIIFAHIEAMRGNRRFIDLNLNRLFSGAWAEVDTGCIEQSLARRLEQEVAFFSAEVGQKGLIHLDFHTAIRDSKIQRFGIEPFVMTVEQASTVTPLLSAIGIEAIVHHCKMANTFSAFSAQEFGAIAYTLELGKVHPFGENDLRQYQNVGESLVKLLSLTDISFNHRPKRYSVCAELIRRETDYQLLVAEDEPNFRLFEQGEVVEMCNRPYIVEHAQEWLIFPNADVPVGQRTGLMLVEDVTDSLE